MHKATIRQALISFVLPGVFAIATALPCVAVGQDLVDFSSAVIVTRSGELPNAEKAAAEVLVEELENRTGVRLKTATEWPAGKAVIAITSTPEVANWGRPLPVREGEDLAERKAEGFRLWVESKAGVPPTVWVIGADGRGTLYGVGALLRNAVWAKGKVALPATLDMATSPMYPIRGHQLGYRTQANSYDAWDVAQYDQYIRELTFFGLNAVENIPFQDDRPTPVMKVSRNEMNRAMSRICDRYDLDYWVWTPADFDLNDAAARARALDHHEAFYKECATISGVFFPGGDPGDNPAELVLPFLEDVSRRLLPVHPDARVWLSLQHFSRQECQFVFEWMDREKPPWFGGLVAGPSAPPVRWTRMNMPKGWKLRDYPDITHNKICQYPVPWWDMAYSMTLGREAINPRPWHMAYIHNWSAPYTDGYISYSDGSHDDVNKTIFSGLSWDPSQDIHDIMTEYCRVFFGPSVVKEAADGTFALENNWRGPLKDNAAVEGTLLLWQQLQEKAPELESNWRWQQNVVRACYDAYTRRRLINETDLEEEANAILAEAKAIGADAAMTQAMAVLNRASENPVSPALRVRIEDLCETLFQSIGLQTSVDRYHASGAERGAFYDFLDLPLNNKWWLEDEFARIKAMASEDEKVARLHQLATWENPGAGSFYDDIGNPAKCPRVKHSEFVYTEPGEETNPDPLQSWWDQGKSRARLSWQNSMYPEAVVYEGLDPDATYTVRVTGYRQSLLRMEGERVSATNDALMEMGDFREFPVDSKYIQDRKLVLTWDRPGDEGHLNWREHSRLSEVWLLKQ